VRVNQMDATVADVFGDWARLWALVAVYGLAAIVAARLMQPKAGPDAAAR
jgi:hypothetical protein